jgi:hypothetical protein
MTMVQEKQYVCHELLLAVVMLSLDVPTNMCRQQVLMLLMLSFPIHAEARIKILLFLLFTKLYISCCKIPNKDPLIVRLYCLVAAIWMWMLIML